MKVWLITIGEPLPIDENSRLLRAGILTNILVDKGHDVIWWTSTFDHVNKKQRFNKNTSIKMNGNLKINLLYSFAYKSNISFKRIINHYGIAREFSRLACLENKPDIILCSLPTLELSLAAAKYGEKIGVPVILDVRDLWPDIFLELAPLWGKWLMYLLLLPMFMTIKAACAKATAIIGITPAFVEWGVKYANRTPSRLDRDFPMGYKRQIPDTKSMEDAKEFWNKHGINEKNGEFIACFFGTLGHQFELGTIIEAARKLMKQKRLFRFVICGSGDNLEVYKDLAKDCDNITFPGWIGVLQIWSLMEISRVGLAPYKSINNFTMNLPNKPIEYLSAGLPVVSSLKGVLKDLLSDNNCGITYENGNAEDLVSVLVDLYDNNDRLKVMANNASALYEKKYMADKVYGDLAHYLEQVIANC